MSTPSSLYRRPSGPSTCGLEIPNKLCTKLLPRGKESGVDHWLFGLRSVQVKDNGPFKRI